MKKFTLLLFLTFSIYSLTAQVKFYSDANYRGNVFSLNEGSVARMATTQIGNDKLSSVSVPIGYRVVLYDHENFGGGSVILTGSVSNLVAKGFNDKTSSVVVEKEGGFGGGNSKETVMIFDLCNFGGTSEMLANGNYGTIPPKLSLKISAIKVPRGKLVEIFTGIQFRGSKLLLNADVSCLSAAWSNRVQSMRVYDDPSFGSGGGSGGNNGGGTSGVAVYDLCNYSGASITLNNGNYSTVPSGLASKISSIKVPRGKLIEVYQGIKFTGAKLVLNADTPCLPVNWSNTILSIIVTNDTGFGSGGQHGGNNGGGGVEQKVYIYDVCNYKGGNTGLDLGNYPTIPGGLSLKISSIKIPFGKKVEVYKGAQFTGAKLVILQNTSCLSEQWDDSIRSMRVMNK